MAGTEEVNRAKRRLRESGRSLGRGLPSPGDISAGGWTAFGAGVAAGVLAASPKARAAAWSGLKSIARALGRQVGRARTRGQQAEPMRGDVEPMADPEARVDRMAEEVSAIREEIEALRECLR